MKIQHVAFIMDGNRRWAQERGLPSLEGHAQGEDRIEPLIDRAIDVGIPYLTFWAFSTENWHRSPDEVAVLLDLYRDALHKKVDDFHKKNVKVHVIGNISMFPNDIQEKTKTWMEKTKHNTRITVNIALSYGGRDEILRAMKKMNQESRIKNNGQELNPKYFENFLDTAGQPDPDLLIRTGGTQRLSGFLLWQMEYAELYFTDLLWPDFTPEEFQKALDEYARRQRRFGK